MSTKRPLRVEDSDGPEATEALGAREAARLAPGDVVLVRGELGAGKTTFVRGACRALGVTGPVTSPTFTIGRRYAGRGGRVSISHLDLYRLADGLDGEDPGLLADYLTPDAIAFVEWPRGGLPGVTSVALEVSLSHAGGDRRRVELRP